MTYPSSSSRAILRREMLARRILQDPQLAAARSARAQELLLASRFWASATNVGLYIPIKGETSTNALMETALQTGKSVYLPRLYDPAHMVFAACDDISTLRPGLYGIPEPPAGPEPARLDLIVMPGVAYDQRGFRLGYGAGCYDRFLAEPCHSAAIVIGLCFAFQIVPALPVEPWDRPAGYLCCEEGMQ